MQLLTLNPCHISTESIDSKLFLGTGHITGLLYFRLYSGIYYKGFQSMINTSLALPFTEEEIHEAIKTYGGTPFFLYSEKIIQQRARTLQEAFKAVGINFYNHFAVKANPNPLIVESIKNTGMGTDCSSDFEIDLSDRLGLHGEEVMHTSNNTTAEEFAKAMSIGAIINLDDISHIPALLSVGVPEILSCRYNPGELKKGNQIIGSPKDIKYGSSELNLIEMYKIMQAKGVKRFGLHTMVVSDERDIEEHLGTTKLLFELALMIRKETGITLEFINMGGGIGVPYTPEQQDVDINKYAAGVKSLYENILGSAGYELKKIRMENGRFITGPAGIYVTKVINVAEKYKTFVGLDGGMQDFPRPGRLKTYHHVSVIGKEGPEFARKTQSITGSLCIGGDVFASDRELPILEKGDIVAIHTAGAHGHATGYNYNGRPRCGEVMQRANSSVMEIIRYPQSLEDLYWGVPGFQK